MGYILYSLTFSFFILATGEFGSALSLTTVPRQLTSA